MVYCWYVPFYVISQLIMLVFQKLCNKKMIILDLLFGVLFPIVGFALLQKTSSNSKILIDIFSHLKHYFPCISFGYIVKKYNVFGWVLNWWPQKVLGRVLSFVIVICIIAMGRHYIPGFDFLYGSIIVFSGCFFLPSRVCAYKPLAFLKTVGRCSANMWYLHCGVEAAIIGQYIQRISFYTDSRIINFLIVFIVLFVVALIFNFFDKTIYIVIDKVTSRLMSKNIKTMQD